MGVQMSEPTGGMARRGQDVCPSGTTAAADRQSRLLSQLPLPSADYVPSLLLSPSPALSHTVLTKTSAGRGHYHRRRTHAAAEAPSG